MPHRYVQTCVFQDKALGQECILQAFFCDIAQNSSQPGFPKGMLISLQFMLNAKTRRLTKLVKKI